jgi:N-acetylneuraminic acid mutarotase
MRRFLIMVLAVGALGAYLYYARGWDWERLYRETLGRIPYLNSQTATAPLGTRGVGVHWEEGAPLDTSRLQGGTAIVDGHVYVVGGLDGFGRTLDSLEIYDLAKDTWTLGPIMPQAMHHPAIATDGKLIYVVGGFLGLSRQTVDMAWAYDPNLREWRELAKPGDFRGGAAATFLDGKLYLLGGVTDAGVTASAEVYDPASDKWDNLPSMSLARQDLAAFALDGKVYAVGGRDSGTDTTDRVEAYDPKTGKWQTVAPLPTKRSDFAAVTWDGQAYVLGGEIPDQAVLGDVDSFDPKTGTWKALTTVLPHPRHGLGAAAWNDRLYTFGGGRRPGWSVTGLNEILFLK